MSKLDWCAIQVALWMPRRVVYWAFIRMWTHAANMHPNMEIPAIEPCHVLQAWKDTPDA